MLPAIRTLLEAAILAPSGDNLQPWRFQVQETPPEIVVAVDDSADTSPMNAGQRMSRIAVGAALQNMLHTARHNGWDVASQFEAGQRIKLNVHSDAHLTGEIPALLSQRVCNRRVYERVDLDRAALAEAQAGVLATEDLVPVWITDRSQLASLADKIAQADMAMFGMQAVRKSFAENIDFQGAIANTPTKKKLSVASLEVSGFERRALQWLPLVPDWLLKLLGGLKPLGQHSRDLVKSAQGLFLILAHDRSPATDFRVGQMLQSAWLQLTAGDFAVQPMMSLAVLDNMAEAGWQPAQAMNGLQRELIQSIAAQTANSTASRIAAILRFGHAPAPSGRVGRETLGHFLAE